jgi:hypothetical protein
VIPSIAFLLYLVLSGLVGLAGRHRRMGFLGFFALSLFTTPVVGALLLYLTEGPTARLRPDATRVPPGAWPGTPETRQAEPPVAPRPTASAPAEPPGPVRPPPPPTDSAPPELRSPS